MTNSPESINPESLANLQVETLIRIYEDDIIFGADVPTAIETALRHLRDILLHIENSPIVPLELDVKYPLQEHQQSKYDIQTVIITTFLTLLRARHPEASETINNYLTS